MRDIVLTLVFMGILPFAVRRTWIGVLLWTWMSIMNPHKLTWGFASTAPFAMVAALATFASLAVDNKSLRIPKDPTVLALVLWVSWMCVSTLNALQVDRSVNDLITVLKIQVMTLIAFMAIRDRKHIEAFLWVIVVSVGFYGMKGGLFTIASGGGGRVWGPPDTYINGNNEVGLALTMIIPLANYLRMVSPHPWVRRGLLLLMLLSAAAVLGTQSRGAFLAIAAMTAVLWTRSKQKVLGGVALRRAFVRDDREVIKHLRQRHPLFFGRKPEAGVVPGIAKRAVERPKAQRLAARASQPDRLGGQQCFERGKRRRHGLRRPARGAACR